MKTNPVFPVLTLLFLCLFVQSSQALDITATGSGNWSSTVPDAPWPDGIVPSTNDSVDVESPFVVLVDTNSACSFLYGGGTITLAEGVTLDVFDPTGGSGTQGLSVFNATAAGCTVNYHCNPYWAKQTDYYNLVLSCPADTPTTFWNSTTPIHVTGDMTISGNNILVQQGQDISVGGNLLILGATNKYDCSVGSLTVTSNTFLLGTNDLLIDLDSADGSNYFGGNVTIGSNALGWNLGDVPTWGIGGNLTNQGLIIGKGYASISFDGTGIITGKAFKIPTLTVNGTYTIGTTITLSTNTPTLNGTLVFDLANTNQLVLQSFGTNLQTLYYSGILDVIDSGAAPVAGKTYKLFNATNYDGTFAAVNLPNLGGGLSWVDQLHSTGSFSVAGGGSPLLSFSRSGAILTLSWDSVTYPGYSVQAQTNSGGIGSNWSATASGTVSPFPVAIDPANRTVFFRLYHP
jgi:hypothetical protein